MMFPSIVPIAQTLSLFLISSSVLISAKCYNPDGTPANNIPCTDATPESTCCGAGYACVGHESSFFLCQPTGEEIEKPGASQFVRGTCTDETWRSSNCPSVCVDPKRDNIAGGHGVARCPNSDRLFYCLSNGLGAVDCGTGHSLIDFVASPTIFTTIGAIPTTASSSSSSRISSRTTSPLASAPESTVNTKPTERPVEPSPISEPSNNNSTTIGIAVGVSIGALGLLAAGIFAWLLMRKGRNQQTADADTSKPRLAADGSYVSGPIEVPGNGPPSRYELPGGGMDVNPAELDSQKRR